jgi:transcriptional regulator with XRE-family HTH domain
MSFDLRKERVNRGLTQAALARVLEVDRGTVIRLERGGTPMADTALRIAQWLDTTPAELWPVAEPERSAA